MNFNVCDTISTPAFKSKKMEKKGLNAAKEITAEAVERFYKEDTAMGKNVFMPAHFEPSNDGLVREPYFVQAKSTNIEKANNFFKRDAAINIYNK